jgi:peptidoglycan/xylan/chitin deacetylase (PgdA/CDA1 family)
MVTHIFARAWRWSLQSGLLGLVVSGTLACLMPLSLVQAQSKHSEIKDVRPLVRNEQASVIYKLDLLRQYWLEHVFLTAALVSRPADQRLKSLTQFVDFQHKLESHRLAIDLVSHNFNKKTNLLDVFFKRLQDITTNDLDHVAYARLSNEMYFQTYLPDDLMLKLRKSRDISKTYLTLMQVTDPVKLTQAPVFKDMNLAELMQRWGRAEQDFARLPNKNELIQMFSQLDVTVPPRTVVLTFDDGPHLSNTPMILDVLKRHRVKAMFFQLGSTFDGDHIGSENVKATLQIQERLLKEGHVVGNHTYSHPHLSKLSFDAASTQITSAQTYISKSVQGSKNQTRFFRPPYGDTDYKTLLAIEDANLYPLFWNIDSRDWDAKTSRQLIERTVKVADEMDGGIILLHDIHDITAQSLSDLIEALRAKRFGFSIWNGQAFVRQPG